MRHIRSVLVVLFVCSVVFMDNAPDAEASTRTTPRDVVDMTVGDNACAVLRNGSAWCWGNGGDATQVVTNIGIPLTQVKKSKKTIMNMGTHIRVLLQVPQITCGVGEIMIMDS